MSPITRRDLLRGAASGIIAAAIRGDLKAAQPSAKPNIVFILADDLGYADVSCYGRPDFRTPKIDHLAARGVRFLQAYANSAVCTATRTALITGRYQYRLRLGLEEPLAGNPDVGLAPEHPTLPSLLKKAGYSSTLIGKWHLGVLPKFGPLKSGYDHFYGFRGGAVDYFSHSNGAREDLWDDDVPVHQAGYLTELLGNRAVEVINAYAKSHQPFMVSLHFSAPHWPWEGPGDEAESKRLAQPGSGGIFHLDGGSQKTYQQMIEAMERQIGRVLQALETNGLTENTIVIFTSDNGGERFADTWPFTGKKTELLEGGLRIPAIVCWPGHIKPRSTTQQLAMTMDWLPTLLAAAGAEPDPAYPSDGMNLLPALTQNSPPVARRVYWRYRLNAQQALRDGDMKYLKINDNSFLFNVVDDPLERANLKDREPDIYKRLVQDYEEWQSTMLALDPAAFTYGFQPSWLADHYSPQSPGASTGGG